MGAYSILVSPKFLVFYAMAALGLTLLFTRRVTRTVRWVAQTLAFFVLGGVIVVVFPSLESHLGMHPSPICSLTRIPEFWITQGRFALGLAVALGGMLGLSLIGRKLFCGWACPLGAFQEMAYHIPIVKKKPRVLSFKATGTLRVWFLLLFCFCLFVYHKNIYDRINAFELMHWNLGGEAVESLQQLPDDQRQEALAGMQIALVLGLGTVALASLFFYRPYCHSICPLGLVTWLEERVALLGVRLDREKCNGCGACWRQAPCSALEPMVKGGKGLLPDCTSCGLCIGSCPQGALKFGLPRKLRS